MFTLAGSGHHGAPLDWVGMFGKALARRPPKWAHFWKLVTRCGPDDGVRWRTVSGRSGRPGRLLVLEGGQEGEWSVGDLLDQPRRQRRPVPDEGVEVLAGSESAGDERLLVHIPETALT
ncbi:MULTISPECIES: hypothetical protein [unclassified Amycolatopsis]|uniref:hypothetical protein n=1 Tax=unclassified Amycolatopsis TaxID=2618356 RepID=UPI002875127E|nr:MULTISPECIES: hypothetical protein [unclassified Amycolatopsis]MDS0131919.1 hypothetical protein [Amycolatopsis sp. 505]MDS0141343.1 hypothetical protein [Amycolatopsis sp. CM201R]